MQREGMPSNGGVNVCTIAHFLVFIKKTSHSITTAGVPPISLSPLPVNYAGRSPLCTVPQSHKEYVWFAANAHIANLLKDQTLRGSLANSL